MCRREFYFGSKVIAYSLTVLSFCQVFLLMCVFFFLFFFSWKFHDLKFETRRDQSCQERIENLTNLYAYKRVINSFLLFCLFSSKGEAHFEFSVSAQSDSEGFEHFKSRNHA